jgi:GTP-binding protein HflX
LHSLNILRHHPQGRSRSEVQVVYLLECHEQVAKPPVHVVEGSLAIPQIEGKTQGLKPNQLRRLEKIYQRRLPPREIITPEFARHLTEISSEIGRQVGVLVDRRGYVEHVIVGDATRIVIPSQDRGRLAEQRFSGLRCLHTHLRGEELTQDDLADLAVLRLDLMAAIDVDVKTGMPGLVRAAHLLPASIERDVDGESTLTARSAYRFLEPAIPSQINIDFLDLIDSLESEMARNRGSRLAADNRDRAILVGVTTETTTEARESLDELKELALSGGLVVIDEIIQRRKELDPKTLVGKGKLDEIIIRSLQLGADMIVFDRELFSVAGPRHQRSHRSQDCRPFAADSRYLCAARANERRTYSGRTCPTQVPASKTQRIRHGIVTPHGWYRRPRTR